MQLAIRNKLTIQVIIEETFKTTLTNVGNNCKINGFIYFIYFSLSFGLQALGFLSSYGIGMEYNQAKVKSFYFF